VTILLLKLNALPLGKDVSLSTLFGFATDLVCPIKIFL